MSSGNLHGPIRFGAVGDKAEVTKAIVTAHRGVTYWLVWPDGRERQITMPHSPAPDEVGARLVSRFDLAED